MSAGAARDIKPGSSSSDDGSSSGSDGQLQLAALRRRALLSKLTAAVNKNKEKLAQQASSTSSSDSDSSSSSGSSLSSSSAGSPGKRRAAKRRPQTAGALSTEARHTLAWPSASTSVLAAEARRLHEAARRRVRRSQAKLRQEGRLEGDAVGPRASLGRLELRAVEAEVTRREQRRRALAVPALDAAEDAMTQVCAMLSSVLRTELAPALRSVGGCRAPLLAALPRVLKRLQSTGGGKLGEKLEAATVEPMMQYMADLLAHFRDECFRKENGEYVHGQALDTMVDTLKAALDQATGGRLDAANLDVTGVLILKALAFKLEKSLRGTMSDLDATTVTRLLASVSQLLAGVGASPTTLRSEVAAWVAGIPARLGALAKDVPWTKLLMSLPASALPSLSGALSSVSKLAPGLDLAKLGVSSASVATHSSASAVTPTAVASADGAVGSKIVPASPSARAEAELHAAQRKMLALMHRAAGAGDTVTALANAKVAQAAATTASDVHAAAMRAMQDSGLTPAEQAAVADALQDVVKQLLAGPTRFFKSVTSSVRQQYGAQMKQVGGFVGSFVGTYAGEANNVLGGVLTRAKTALSALFSMVGMESVTDTMADVMKLMPGLAGGKKKATMDAATYNIISSKVVEALRGELPVDALTAAQLQGVAKTVLDKRLHGGIRNMFGVSTGQLVAIMAVSSVSLLSILAFVFIGINVFTSGGNFASVVNSLVVAGAGLGMGGGGGGGDQTGGAQQSEVLKLLPQTIAVFAKRQMSTTDTPETLAALTEAGLVHIEKNAELAPLVAIARKATGGGSSFGV